MEEPLSRGDGLLPKQAKEEEAGMEEKALNPSPDPSVKRLLSHLGWKEEVPTLAMFTPSDDGDWFPGNLTPGVYQALVGGPRLQCLEGLGFGLGWALRGRVFYPKGVLPTSLFIRDQCMEQKSSLFHKELFFSLRQVGELTDSECVYQVKFTPVPLWPEDWWQHRLEPRLQDSLEVHSEIHCLPVESHAKHARDLGLCLGDLDRIDGLLPVRHIREPDLTIWRVPQFSAPVAADFGIAENTPIEADCVEVLFGMILEKAVTIPGWSTEGEAKGKCGSPSVSFDDKSPSSSSECVEEISASASLSAEEISVAPSLSAEEIAASLSVTGEEITASASMSTEEISASASLSIEEISVSPRASVEETYTSVSVSVENDYALPSASVEEDPNLSETSAAIMPKKRSLKKRTISFLRRLFRCASRPGQRH